MSILASLIIEGINTAFPKRKGTRDANTIIAQATKVRPLKVEQKITYVRNRFKTLMKAGEISRYTLLEIEKYLLNNVPYPRDKHFKNQAHCVYSYLKYGAFTNKQIDKLNQLVQG